MQIRNSHIVKNLAYYFMIACAFLLPLHKVIIPYVIGTWAFIAIFTYSWKEYFYKYKNNLLFWVFPLLYFFSLITLLYTNNISDGLFKLEVKLSYLMLPILMLPAAEYSIKKRFKILRAFVYGNLLAVLICIVIASFHFDTLGMSTFYYYNLSFFHHTSYFAMYLAFAISILYVCYINKKTFKIAKWIFFPVLFLFIAVIYFLSSKSGLISVVVLIIIFLGILLKKSFSWTNVIFSIMIIGSTVFIVSQNHRLSGATQKISKGVNPKSTESNATRLQVWSASINIIQNNILLGTTPGDANDVLISEYQKLNYKGAIKKQLNSHNQFIQTQLSLGIIGTLLLLSAFVLSLIKNGRKSIILVFFLSITIFNFLFESVLEAQSGVIFFIFFFSFLNTTNTNNYDTLFSSKDRPENN